MGAGSTKGVNINDEDKDIDNDRFSITSNDSPLPLPKSLSLTSNNNKPIQQNETPDLISSPEKVKRVDQKKPSIKIKPHTPEASPDNPAPVPSVFADEGKKKGLFGFPKRKEEEEKTSAFIHEEEEEATKKTSKKESSKGFKFFNFKKEGKKSTEKDEHLDQEIKELQKTFDTLGIVGKSVWDDDAKGEQKSKKSQSADDIRNLEPMRNRMNARRRPSRTQNGNTGGDIPIRKGSDSLNNSSGGSRKVFKYSWETENESSSNANDEWTYQAIVIEGFDIEKFKQANFQDSILDGDFGRRIPNSIIGDSPVKSSSGSRSPLTYDPMEQKLLATIERDFAL